MKNYLNKILISFFTVISLGFSQDNYSLSFDGVDDYVEVIGLDNFLPSNLSVSEWVKFASLSNVNPDSPVSGDINIDYSKYFYNSYNYFKSFVVII